MSERVEFHPLPAEEDKTDQAFPARKIERIREEHQKKEEAQWTDLTEELERPDESEKKAA